MENRNTKVSKIVFQIRAGTFDVKSWQQWKYEDNLCPACLVYEENMEHFMNCKSYGRKNKQNWKNIYENKTTVDEKTKIAMEAIERGKLRKIMIPEGGRTSSPGSRGSIIC